MWSEESDMDNKIRKAAETDSHRFQLKDWQKMEALLDEHLPQEKKRRRFIFIFLFSALIVATGIFLVQRFSTKSASIADQTQKTEQNNINISSADKNEKGASIENKNISGESVDKKTYPDDLTQLQDNISAPIATREVKKKAFITKKTTIPENQVTLFPNITGSKRERSNNVDPIKKTDVLSFDNSTKSSEPENNDNISIQSITDLPEKKDTSITNTGKKEIKIDSAEISVETKTPEKQNITKKKDSKFSINLSAGTDISSVGTKPEIAEIAYGLGIGYSLSDKWTIRTGFFASRKKYEAKPGDYHPDDVNFWYYYPNMQNIDANCFVYEIPVNIVYSFGKKKDHNWFLSAGLSSFLMNKETYDYTYKNNLGQTRYYTQTFKNEYSHIFSILNFSGGYQHTFNSRISLLAEPYIKVPLSGIGFGNVQLNSAGIMFTISIKPFVKKESK